MSQIDQTRLRAILAAEGLTRTAGSTLGDLWAKYQKPAEKAYGEEAAAEIKKHVMDQAKSRFQKGYRWSEDRGIYKFTGTSTGGQRVYVGLQVNPRLGVILNIKIDGRDAPGFSGHISAERVNSRTAYDIANLYFMDVD